MTRAGFLAALATLGLNRREFAEVVKLGPAVVYHWGAPGYPVPGWVPVLLSALLDLQALKADRAALRRRRA